MSRDILDECLELREKNKHLPLNSFYRIKIEKLCKYLQMEQANISLIKNPILILTVENF